ncbi:MAG TPA: L,D-transpeptidase [Candidatus Acidoferrum sp.]|nr:L,D-transpeptidase [Candidatus Acidoferrum sp.]
MLALGLLFLMGCRAPALPPEAVQADLRQAELRAAQAESYLPEAFRAFRADLARAEAKLATEYQRWFFLRDLGPVRGELAGLVRRADALLTAVKAKQEERSRTLARRAEVLQAELDRLGHLSALLNERRLSRRSLTHASLLVAEAQHHIGRARYLQAEAALREAEILGRLAQEPLGPLLGRFVSGDNLARWHAWVQETIRESARTGGYAIVVSKVDRRLLVYRAGAQVTGYEAAIGLNGFSLKQLAGDRATPEGRYRILKKKAASRFYKAFLIDYPNAEDRRRFLEGKRRGLIASTAAIGGLIEIHGGGVAGMTDGCIALENPSMGELFSLVGEGTPVTIVGALDSENVVARALREYREAK